MDILQHSVRAAQLILDSMYRQVPRSFCCNASVDATYPEDPVCSLCGKHCSEHCAPRDEEPSGSDA